MEKICVVCGTSYSAGTKYGKYCSAYCRNRSRYSLSREEYTEKMDKARAQVIDLYDSDMTVAEIVKITGMSKTFIYSTWRKAGLKRRLTGFQLEVKKLREQGKCCVEIAEELGKRTSAVRQTAIAIGMPFTDEEIRTSQKIGHDKLKPSMDVMIERQLSFVREYLPGWKYIDGFINSDDYMTLQCLECGCIIKRSSISIRHHKSVVCPTCHEKEQRLRQAEKEQKQEDEKARRQEEKIRAFWRQNFQQEEMMFVTCPECGTPHLQTRTKFCSIQCRNKARNRKSDHRLREGITFPFSLQSVGHNVQSCGSSLLFMPL